MIGYVNLFIYFFLIMFGSTWYVYYKLKKFFCLISVIIDSEILDQLTNLEKNVDSEVTKTRKGRKKKTLLTINEVDENDIRDREKTNYTCSIW